MATAIKLRNIDYLITSDGTEVPVKALANTSAVQSATSGSYNPNYAADGHSPSASVAMISAMNVPSSGFHTYYLRSFSDESVFTDWGKMDWVNTVGSSSAMPSYSFQQRASDGSQMMLVYKSSSSGGAGLKSFSSNADATTHFTYQSNIFQGSNPSWGGTTSNDTHVLCAGRTSSQNINTLNMTTRLAFSSTTTEMWWSTRGTLQVYSMVSNGDQAMLWGDYFSNQYEYAPKQFQMMSFHTKDTSIQPAILAGTFAHGRGSNGACSNGDVGMFIGGGLSVSEASYSSCELVSITSPSTARYFGSLTQLVSRVGASSDGTDAMITGGNDFNGYNINTSQKKSFSSSANAYSWGTNTTQCISDHASGTS